MNCLRLLGWVTVSVVLAAVQPHPLLAEAETIDLKSLAKKARPAVMRLVVIDRGGREVATGTGFLVSPDGKLITNHHVIQNAAQIVAKSEDGRQLVVQGVLADSPRNDLALLRVEGKDLPFLRFSDADKVEVGTRVAVIGSPLGLEGTLSEGIVSAVRTVAAGVKMLQTTAAISSGSSGSPVLNANGEVVGIASSVVMREGQALNFAIPGEFARDLMARLGPQAGVLTPLPNAAGPAVAPQPAAGSLPKTLPAGGIHKGPLRLAINLVDGSRVIGGTDRQALTVQSEALGKMEIPLNRIWSIKFSANHDSATVVLGNGDKLQGRIAVETMIVRALFGEVTIPLAKVAEMTVTSEATAARNIEWEAMPFPAVQWSGSRGECVLIEADGLLLQGQPLRGSQTFRAPVTVTCEITPERLHIGNTALFVEFIPTGLAKDADVVKTPGARRFFVYTGESHSIGWQCLQEGRWQAVWSDNLPALKVNEPHRLEIQVGPEQLRVRMDGKEYDAGKVPGPPEEFQIQLWNWQPDSRWRVRNVTVR